MSKKKLKSLEKVNFRKVFFRPFSFSVILLFLNFVDELAYLKLSTLENVKNYKFFNLTSIQWILNNTILIPLEILRHLTSWNHLSAKILYYVSGTNPSGPLLWQERVSGTSRNSHKRVPFFKVRHWIWITWISNSCKISEKGIKFKDFQVF